MVQRFEHDSELDTSTLDGGVLEKQLTRRNILLGAFGLGGATVLTAGYRQLSSGKQNPTERGSAEKRGERPSRGVTLEESRARIQELNQDPELFDDIDPHILHGLTFDELVAIGGVSVTEANRNSVDVWAQDYLDKHLLFMRAGGTKEDLLLGIDKYGIQTGVRDDSGVLMTSMVNIEGERYHESHGEFINRHYGVPMLTGMGPDSFKGRDMSKVKDAMLYAQKRSVDLFEGWVTSLNPAHSTLNTTTRFEPYSEEEPYRVRELDVRDGAFFDLDGARRVRIDFQTWQNSGNDKLINKNSVTMTYKEDVDTDRYLIMFEHFVSSRL